MTLAFVICEVMRGPTLWARLKAWWQRCEPEKPFVPERKFVCTGSSVGDVLDLPTLPKFGDSHPDDPNYRLDQIWLYPLTLADSRQVCCHYVAKTEGRP